MWGKETSPDVNIGLHVARNYISILIDKSMGGSMILPPIY